MFDDLANYFYHKVWKDYQAFADAKDDGQSGTNNDLRLAIHAAESLYHLREHIPQTHQKNRSQIAAICPDYNLLGDIFNAAKHKVLTQGNPQITNAENIYEQVTLTRYEDVQGEYYFAEKVILVKLDNGSSKNIYEILTNVLNFWLIELHSLGVIEYREPVTIENKIPSRENSKLDLEITKGLNFRMNFQLLEYDYKTNTKKPVDLTGADIKFVISPLPSDVDVVLTNEETGEEIKQTMKLSEEQSHKIVKMNEQEASDFLMQIAKENSLFSGSLVED